MTTIDYPELEKTCQKEIQLFPRWVQSAILRHAVLSGEFLGPVHHHRCSIDSIPEARRDPRGHIIRPERDGCTMFLYDRYAVCCTTGNVHTCTATECEYIVTRTDPIKGPFRACTLTGNEYPLSWDVSSHLFSGCLSDLPRHPDAPPKDVEGIPKSFHEHRQKRVKDLEKQALSVLQLLLGSEYRSVVDESNREKIEARYQAETQRYLADQLKKNESWDFLTFCALQYAQENEVEKRCRGTSAVSIDEVARAAVFYYFRVLSHPEWKPDEYDFAIHCTAFAYRAATGIRDVLPPWPGLDAMLPDWKDLKSLGHKNRPITRLLPRFSKYMTETATYGLFDPTKTYGELPPQGHFVWSTQTKPPRASPTHAPTELKSTNRPTSKRVKRTERKRLRLTDSEDEDSDS